MARKMGSTKMASGRPWGTNSNSGKKLMTSYTKPFNGSPVIVVTGKPQRSNGTKNLKGRATKDWSGDPNRTKRGL